MERLVFGEATGNVPDVGNCHESRLVDGLFGWNICYWHLGVNVSVKLIDRHFFHVAFHLNCVDFSERNTVRVGAEMTIVDAH